MLAQHFKDKAKPMLKDELKLLRESKDQSEIRMSAYTSAGLIKALGMNTIVELELFKPLIPEFQSKKSDPLRKFAGLILFETLSKSMGRSFEVYLPEVFSYILSSIAEQKEFVRQAALSALKTVMSSFTNFAIKQALPKFLEELEHDNWRSKFATVEALGNMAFCAPK